ncbi:4Fe-4S dicluster domain-containing protein [Cytobacillus spongiae]|jgi:formate dehydrogenase iron-sulfur subunit|uniref:4Fe-4S dicluster domain-containing protein n=1 Tax=Cytobacillus spongiae TaxID=2901381 RepID=UPI001F3B2EB7|nr:4Fe-4S dicluster domain-containing protein [Cytobacillus spongiae]UII55812.1 4Fe-4S dicluster domain-containing protein [Cytobacillus spongiae]
MADYIKFVDVTKCDGCRACMVACKNWNDLPAEPESFSGSYQSHENLTANTWNVITFNEQETAGGGFEWLFRHQSCLHCGQAACEKACPEDAISHTKFGSVVINADKCVGCGYCVENCTFDVVKLATYKDQNGKEYRKAQKCTLCTDRLEEGLQPACVTACHTDCLIYDEKEKVLSEANTRLAKIKDRFPNANVYNPQGIEGTTTVYLLADKPSVYGLPENPKVPLSQVVWKDYAQPIGKAMFGVTTMAVVGAVLSNALKKDKDGKGGQDHHE